MILDSPQRVAPASAALASKGRETSSRTTAPPNGDYVAIADAFAAEAISDTDGDRHCKWVRLAASRYLKDRIRAESIASSYYFSEEWANDACDFIEKLPHIEGKWDTDEIILHPAHVFFLVNLFGFRTQDGTRRFTSALLSIARKNAKSLLAASILIYCLCCEDEPGAQVISAATTGSQARIVFNAAKKIIEQTPDLCTQFGLEPYANSVACLHTGSNFKPINSKASTQDGLNPSHCVMDEIHAHKSHDLLNVLQSAAGARSNALWLYVTTEGYETPGPWPEMRKFSQQLLSGIIEADHFFALIFALDDAEGEPGQPGYRPADEDFDSTKWIKANPLMEVNPILAREIKKAASDAKQMPGRHAEFRIKRLNRQSAAAKAWLNIERWKRCNGEVDLTMLEGKRCFGAIDGASTTDIMAFRLIWEIDAVVYTAGWRWVPTDSVAVRTERKTVPYAAWCQTGLIRQTPGHTIDYEVVERDIIELMHRFDPESVAYDSWNLRDLITRLKKEFPDTVGGDGKTVSHFQEFRQGPKSFHPAMKAAEKLYLDGNLRHGGDPVLNWCASNVVPRLDANLAMAPDRAKSADKIDDAVALFMAVGEMERLREVPDAVQLF